MESFREIEKPWEIRRPRNKNRFSIKFTSLLKLVNADNLSLLEVETIKVTGFW
jgi:rRNA pseudouridine-1189 N-methylase Emg1 (Nep1/Mra1 family)